MADRALDSLAALQAAAAGRRHRALVVICGPGDWARGEAARLLAGLPEPKLWVGAADCPLPEVPVCAPNDSHRYLGQDLGSLVWDSRAGMHPSGFAALTGTLVAGGVLLWLVPPLKHWPEYPDPDYGRLRDHRPPYRFLARIARVLAAADPEQVHWHTPESPLDRSPEPPAAPPALLAAGPTDEQQQAMAAVRKVAHGHRRRPLVIRADRGRGKSSLLGMVARELTEQGLTIAATAPRPRSLDSFYRWLGEAAAGHCPYQPPDYLLRERPPADLLLVDEAAAIPVPLLSALLQHYPRVVFATTVHGYEGTGRGFDLRFRDELTRQTPGWHLLNLQTPIRWGENDPLEPLVNRLLLLDAEPAQADPEKPDPVIRPLDRDDLLEDEPALQAIVGLLVSAHYQTSPDDVRQLLDDPDTRLWVAWQGDTPVAVLWLLLEGGLPPSLADAVWRGERRPRGHLLAQSLAAHGGDPSAACLHYGRITRIAVHPALRRRGLGQALVAAAREGMVQRDVDVLGVSFGATPDLLPFWQRCGLGLLRLGLRRDAASGTHAAMLGQGLTSRGGRLCDYQAARFAQHWPVLLLSGLKSLESGLVWTLSAMLPAGPVPDRDDCRELDAFSAGHRDLALCLLPLQRCHGHIPRWGHRVHWSDADRSLWVQGICQGHSWDDLRHQGLVTGRKEAAARLRAMAGEVLEILAENPLTGRL